MRRCVIAPSELLLLLLLVIVIELFRPLRQHNDENSITN
jgi:hypothetical protein